MNQQADRFSRVWEDTSRHDDDKRSEFQHDRDRVLYSSSFRRLAGITQVASADERHLLHNRLTHSLKVAQLARRMTEYLLETSSLRRCVDLNGKVDADVAEAAGLIHDLGHPPFGHAAEDQLDQLMKNAGGFEGNAQSFRIVTRLAARDPHPSLGLNLTRATLNASLKYPNCMECSKKPRAWTDRSRGKKWGVYEDDLGSYLWVREEQTTCHDSGPKHTMTTSETPQRTPEAILVDWADDVSYATHDIEDYYRAGIIPLHEIFTDSVGFIEGARAHLGDQPGYDDGTFEAARRSLLERNKPAKWRPFADSREDRVKIRKFASNNIEYFVGKIKVVPDHPYLEIDVQAQYEVEILKFLTVFFVIQKAGLSIAQQGQKRLIKTLFKELLRLLKGKDEAPKALQELLKENEAADEAARKRAVCDYIASLTEAQAVDLHTRLMTADSRSSIFGTWF